TKDETIELIEAAIVRADTIRKPWSSEELTQTLRKVRALKNEELNGYVVHHNWVVNTPMEVGAAEPEKALIALKTAENYRSRFGMFVTGIDRDESQEKAEKWEVFSYVGAVMTLPTGVQAIGEVKYGNPDKALEYLKMLENSFGYALPGSMYEVSPDFGMVAQGWNIYAVAVPIVDHFFGIQPMAYDQEILISPNLPSTWPSGSFENVKVGDNEISISFERVGETIQYEIEQTKDWTIHFRIGDETTSSKDHKQSFKR
ncbi:MAG: glycogen debranching protein, partial [Cyclobacteriaceae bacterium]